jgi:hypothetical protein
VSMAFHGWMIQTASSKAEINGSIRKGGREGARGARAGGKNGAVQGPAAMARESGNEGEGVLRGQALSGPAR